MPNQAIFSISDTAMWMAFYRALENERENALFHDSYARLLAGERGREIVRSLPFAKYMAWAMIVRTYVFDEIILRLIREDSVDTVLNLAAGLDTRPYRLPLSFSLWWIEVDLPGILSYKEEKLQGEQPACRLERVKLDLSDVSTRRELFAKVAGSSKRVLIVSEGLLVYLSPEGVTSLAKDLSVQPNFQWWLTDLASPVLLRSLQRRYGKYFASAGIKMQFGPEEGPDFFLPFHWELREFRNNWEEAHRLKLKIPLAWLWKLLLLFSSKAKRKEYKKAGIVLLQRQ